MLNSLSDLSWPQVSQSTSPGQAPDDLQSWEMLNHKSFRQRAGKEEAHEPRTGLIGRDASWDVRRQLHSQLARYQTDGKSIKERLGRFFWRVGSMMK